MIIPAKETHKLFQGATWERRYRVVDEQDVVVDISGCTATLSARESLDSEEAAFSVEGVVSGAAGEVLFTVPADTAVGETWEKLIFDAELYWPGTKIDKLAYGSFKVIREVTHV